MKKEFNLSEKIIDGEGKYFKHLTAFEVKEFIKKERKIIARYIEDELPELWKELNKIAGEDLI